MKRRRTIHEITECCCVCLSGEHQRNNRQFGIRRRSAVFSRLEAKEALDTTLSKQSQSNLHKSMQMPDYVYLPLKVRTKISDAGWQTLLNLTQLGRTGVCLYVSSYIYRRFQVTFQRAVAKFLANLPITFRSLKVGRELCS